jgi:hypothetical protein
VRLALPARLIQVTANMSNFGALFVPFVLMYRNSKLPRAARQPGYAYVLLFLNFLFFGFFFINFVADEFRRARRSTPMSMVTTEEVAGDEGDRRNHDLIGRVHHRT